jgi:hypothetical protein
MRHLKTTTRFPIQEEAQGSGLWNYLEEESSMQVTRRLRLKPTLGILILAGAISGCSMFSASNAPVDCDAVKNQEQAGFSDAKIASDLGSTVDKVAACRGPKTAVGPQD